MNLAASWEYILSIAKQRLEHNRTSRHVDDFGPDIETLGAAGELAARRFLGLPENLHTNFDNGADLVWNSYKVDVKATRLTHSFRFRFLQWPEWKPVKADIILLTAVNMDEKSATVVGWTTRPEIQNAPVNNERFIPCHEIPITDLRPPWELTVPGFVL